MRYATLSIAVLAQLFSAVSCMSVPSPPTTSFPIVLTYSPRRHISATHSRLDWPLPASSSSKGTQTPTIDTNLSGPSTTATSHTDTTSSTATVVVAVPPPKSPNPLSASRLLLRRSHNGCGPAGFGWLVPEYKFHECCNTHDECWGTCSKAELQVCNDAFLACMRDVCQNAGMYYDEHIRCFKKADGYHRAVTNWLARAAKKVLSVECWGHWGP
ncbi:hypothetical protein MBLNU459_g2912t1 [Dothideomycetes sp. NU459]